MPGCRQLRALSGRRTWPCWKSTISMSRSASTSYGGQTTVRHRSRGSWNLVGNDSIIRTHPREQSIAVTWLDQLPYARADVLPASTTTRMAVAPDPGSSIGSPPSLFYSGKPSPDIVTDLKPDEAIWSASSMGGIPCYQLALQRIKTCLGGLAVHAGLE